MTNKMNFITKLLTPIRLFLPHDFLEKKGIQSIREDRTNVVLKYVKGRLLDIGCGKNLLVKKYGNNSIGVDIYDFGGGATIIENAAHLPFADNAFDTVSFVACFNHISNRLEVLEEVRRVLKNDGRVVLTEIIPIVGKLRHKMRWIEPIEEKRIKEQKQPREEDGLADDYLLNLFQKFGFGLEIHEKFIMNLNNVYVFKK